MQTHDIKENNAKVMNLIDFAHKTWERRCEEQKLYLIVLSHEENSLNLQPVMMWRVTPLLQLNSGSLS